MATIFSYAFGMPTKTKILKVNSMEIGCPIGQSCLNLHVYDYLIEVN
jgi:hypothetical protein